MRCAGSSLDRHRNCCPVRPGSKLVLSRHRFGDLHTAFAYLGATEEVWQMSDRKGNSSSEEPREMRDDTRYTVSRSKDQGGRHHLAHGNTAVAVLSRRHVRIASRRPHTLAGHERVWI